MRTFAVRNLLSASLLSMVFVIAPASPAQGRKLGHDIFKQLSSEK